jgi:hypothetical protein
MYSVYNLHLTDLTRCKVSKTYCKPLSNDIKEARGEEEDIVTIHSDLVLLSSMKTLINFAAKESRASPSDVNDQRAVITSCIYLIIQHSAPSNLSRVFKPSPYPLQHDSFSEARDSSAFASDTFRFVCARTTTSGVSPCRRGVHRPPPHFISYPKTAGRPVATTYSTARTRCQQCRACADRALAFLGLSADPQLELRPI